MSIFIAVNETKHGEQIRAFRIEDVQQWDFYPASPAGVEKDDDNYLASHELRIKFGEPDTGAGGFYREDILLFHGLTAEIVRDALLDFSKMETVYEPEPQPESGGMAPSAWPAGI